MAAVGRVWNYVGSLGHSAFRDLRFIAAVKDFNESSSYSIDGDLTCEFFWLCIPHDNTSPI